MKQTRELYCRHCGKIQKYVLLGSDNTHDIWRCTFCFDKQSLPKTPPEKPIDSAPAPQHPPWRAKLGSNWTKLGKP